MILLASRVFASRPPQVNLDNLTMRTPALNIAKGVNYSIYTSLLEVEERS
jgi:hypothetical protein